MADGDERVDVGSYIDRLIAVQSQALQDTRKVLQRMGENLQMGGYTPQSWAGDVFELWDVALRNGGATWRALLGAGPGAAPSPNPVSVIHVPRGVETWQFSVDVDPGPLRSVGRARLETRGFEPASGGFSIEYPRNVDFIPASLEPSDAGPVKVTVVLFSLPDTLSPGCYSGTIEAHPLEGDGAVLLADVHLRVADKGGPRSVPKPDR